MANIYKLCVWGPNILINNSCLIPFLVKFFITRSSLLHIYTWIKADLAIVTMVDLNTYRSRIGSFLSRHFSYMRDGSRYRNRSRSHENTCYSMDMKCLFLLVVGLTFLRIHFDPAVEWNPGPHNRKQSMVYRSASEKKLFNELRSIDSLIARCASHRFFLGNNLVSLWFLPDKHWIYW